MKKLSIISSLVFIFFAQNIFAQIDAYKAENYGYYTSTKVTNYGIAATDNYSSKIYLIKKGISKEVLASPNCGKFYAVSPNGEYIGYKNFTENGQQVPAMLSLKTGKIINLYKAVEQCGQVSFSNDGKIAFSVANSIVVKDGETFKTFEVGTYSNITPISPDGNFVVYDKDQESLYLLDLKTGNSTEIYNQTEGCIYPKWSPDGTKLLFSNRNSELLVWEKASNKINLIDKGGNGEWNKTSDEIVYQKNKVNVETLEFLGSDIYIASANGLKKQNITNSTDVNEMAPNFDGEKVIYNTYNQREIISAKLSTEKKSLIEKEVLLKQKSLLNIQFYDVSKFVNSKAIKMVSGDVPYVHQLYDAPTGANGGSACAPTTSTMALAFYNRLPKWPIAANNYTSVTGTNHTNDYSGYVLAKYRYNEHYFDAYSTTKNAYGGYAYMWVAPYTSPGSGGMKAFQDHHNMTSGNIVWTSSCTVAKTKTEIDGNYPHPICSWITHSGHLTLAVGYVVGQNTIIFNDPWGNKNTPGYPSYDGKNSYYDWPGYNNGYQNLDPDGSHGTVAWTLTARSTQPTYDNLAIQNNYYNHGFYMNNSQNGSTQSYYRHVKNAAGSNGQIWWTGGEGGASSDICYATWTPTITQTASYKVEVYVPATFTDVYSSVAVTSSANYKIFYNGGNTTVSVNQFAKQGTWVDLGTFQFVQGQTGYVRLGDAVAVADAGKKVLFDAVKFTQVAGSIVVASTNVSCTGSSDGTATVTTSPGVAPHTYDWSSGQSNASISGLAAGTYSVTVTDANSTPYVANVIILEPSTLLSISSSKTDPSAFGLANGTITANVTGGNSPYSYAWTPNVSTTNLAQNLAAGDYTISVTDANGCMKQTSTTLIEPICTSCCVLLTENFAGQTLPSGWLNTINSGGYATYNWRFNNPKPRTVTGADFDANFAILDADYLDNPGLGNKADASLQTKAINCTGRNDVRLKFAHKFIAGVTHVADAKVEVSNDGTNWNVLQAWSTVSVSTPIYQEYDISAYAANQATVYLKWTYTDRTYYSNYWAIDNIEVYAPPAGTKTISANGGDYANFTEAINALNNCGVGTNGITFLVPADEVFTENPPTVTATGTSANPVIFQKTGTGANPIIKSTGTVATNDAAITILGGDYFTFDGIDIQQASGTALEYGYYLKNSSATDGAQNNTIKNCTITLDKTNTNSAGIYQLISVDPSDATGANSNNSYQNNTISNSYMGIVLDGDVVAIIVKDLNNVISNCVISNFGGNIYRAVGVFAWSQSNLSLNNNNISAGNSTAFTSGNDGRCYGIYAAGDNTGSIFRNKISNISGVSSQVAGIRTYNSTMDVYLNDVSNILGVDMSSGIEAYGGTVNIYNNLVYDIKSPTGNSTVNAYPSTRGISLRFTTGTQTVFNNTVYVSYTSTNTNNESTCLFIESSTVNSQNNIFENNTLATTGTRAVCVYFKTTADVTNLSASTRNNLFWVGTTSAKYAVAYNSATATTYQSLANYVAALVSPREQSGTYLNPPYKSTISPYNVHIDVTSAQASAFNNLGTVISSPFAITADFDGDTRNVSTPDVGADEFTPENYLCGTYTINNTLATSGTNFHSFTDAINALNDRGISCSVVFNVHDNQTFTEEIPAIETSGTLANTITFQKSGTGANPILKPSGTTSTEDAAIKINAGDYFTFDGIDVLANSTNLEIGYYLTNISATNGAQHNSIKNCSITLNNSNLNSAGIYQYIQTSINPTSADGANSFNVYENVSVSNSYNGIKIYGYDVTGQETLYDDATEVKNCTVNNFGLSGGTIRAVGILTWSQKNLKIHNNTISNGTTNYRTLGIYGAGNVQGAFYNNTVHTLYGTGAQVVGLRSWESNIDFYNNNSYDIQGIDMASGIEIYGGSANIYNNLISDIRTPNTSTYNFPTTRGISNRNGDANIFNNSIYLDYVSTASTNESAGIFVEGISTDFASADIRNNIVVNNVDVTTGAIAAALYKSAEYSSISTNSDNNIYYAGTPSDKNLIFYDTNSGEQTIADYLVKTSSYEQNSNSEMPPFVSINKPCNLHLQTTVATLCNNEAQVISTPNILTDFDGDVRNVSTPDVGADEFDGISPVICINTTSTDIQTICETYTWMDGITYTASNNTATFILPNAGGCDSTITLNLTIKAVPVATIVQVDQVLSSVNTATSYHWLDCDNFNSPIVDEIYQDFVIPGSGNYAVKLTTNGCEATSDCYLVISTEISKNNLNSNVSIFPNPTNGKINVKFENINSDTKISILDLTGKSIIEREILAKTTISEFDLSKFPKGIYLMKVLNNEKIKIEKIVVE